MLLVPHSIVDLDVVPDSIELAVAEDSPVQPDPPVWTSFEIDDGIQFFILHVESALEAGAHYRLSLAFTGTLVPPTQSGFYFDFYETGGETR